MKILHIVPGIRPTSGGPTRSITGLCRALAQAGVDTTLLVHRQDNDMHDPSGVRFIKGDGVGLMDVWRNSDAAIRKIRPDVVHLHALWMTTNHIAFSLAHRYKVPVMLSVRGNLDPWALKQKAFKKKIAMICYQKRDLRRAAGFHATARQEMQNIQAQGLTQPIWIIPNGVEVPAVLPERSCCRSNRRIALFLSRLHPGKGLVDLVQAWAIIRPQGWQMRIVGPDVCGHKAEVQAEIEKNRLQDDFVFIGNLDDDAKWREYANADLFVLPSHSENFGIAVAEALAAGLPVITTKGTPWSELHGGSDSTASRCGWWIDIGPGPLADALLNAMSLTDDERRGMGRNGQKLVGTKYCWPVIASQMITAYASIAAQHGGRREQPV